MDLASKETLILITLGSVFLFGFFILFIVAFVITYQKRRLKIENKNIEIQTLLKLSLSDAHIEIREETLKQVSEELHDSVCQMLGVLLLNLDNVKNDIHLTESLLKPLVRQTINEVRTISKGMDTTILKNAELHDAIQKHLELFKSSGIIFTFEYNNVSSQISYAVKVIIFRIFQELIQNALKHSEANNIYISLKYLPESTEFTFMDDGVGFEIDNIKSGSGVSNIKNRISKIKATFEFTSSLNDGTKFKLSIPYER